MSDTIRLLHVEDVADDAELIWRELSRAGMSIEARRVEKEISFLGELHSFRPDIVISDYSLPEFDGMRALKLAREHAPAVPVIIVTGSQNEEVAVECMRAGAADYVIKEHLARLPAAIGSALAHRRLERERTALIRRLSQAVESSPAAVIITSPDGTIEYVNRRFTLDTGYPAEEASGRNPRMLKSGQTPPEVYRELWDTLSAGGEWRGELLNRKKSGELYWAVASISAILDEAGQATGYVGVTQDITESKRSEAALHESQQQLVQAQKMEAVGRLAGGIAHDFNNILMAVLLQGKVLSVLAAGNEPLLRRVEAIMDAGQRAAALTRQLLAFSRPDPVKAEILSAAAVVRDFREMLLRLVTEDVILDLDLDLEVSNIYGDRGQLEQVLMNLVVNARDAMPQGGHIRIVVRDAPSEEVTSAGGDGGVPHVLLAVIDDGAGMDTGTLQRIFDPFFTTKPKDKGTGLGLSIVYGLVTRAGGLIRVASEPGRGSTFHVLLPASEPRNPLQVSPVDQPAIVDLRGTETILVVEDDPLVRHLVSTTLKTNGYSVLQARDGSEALEVARTSPAIDLLLSDVVMPTINGVEVARTLAGSRPAMRVVLMSGYAQDTLDSYGVNAPEKVTLHKPFTEDRLLTVVRGALGPAKRTDDRDERT
ncbi:MAG: response regulator [Thermoanaerobaculia bacterium]